MTEKGGSSKTTTKPFVSTTQLLLSFGELYAPLPKWKCTQRYLRCHGSTPSSINITSLVHAGQISLTKDNKDMANLKPYLVFPIAPTLYPLLDPALWILHHSSDLVTPLPREHTICNKECCCSEASATSYAFSRVEYAAIE